MGEAFVAGMAARLLHGQPLAKIAQWLDDEGMPSPQKGKWSLESISQIMRNPVLAGKRNNGHKAVLPCSPILDVKTWKRVQRQA